MPWCRCPCPSTSSRSSSARSSNGSRRFVPPWAGSRWPRRSPGQVCISVLPRSGGCSRRSRGHTNPGAEAATDAEGHIVTAKYPGHVWHVDLTVVPIGGFWTRWLPFALPQSWPFCYWVAVVIDHCSRRVMGVTAFKSQPTCEAVCGFLGRTIGKAGKPPRYIVCDRGRQFDSNGFWLQGMVQTQRNQAAALRGH